MKKLICLLLAITTCAWAQLEPFPQYIDHHKFVQLQPEQQRQFLLSLMETLAEMEQAALEEGRLQPANVMTKRQVQVQKMKEILNRFTSSMAIPNAYAQGTPEVDTRFCQKSTFDELKRGAFNPERTCTYGGYTSTMTMYQNKPICVRPACSPNLAIQKAHNDYAQLNTSCGVSSMACNPALYGVGSASGKPSCVQLDVVQADGSWKEIGHNASLSCLMVVASDPNKDQRLQRVADEIAKCDSKAASEFNQLLQMVTNACICGESAFGEGAPPHLRSFDKGYVRYMSSHRTCYSLLSSTAMITEKINPVSCNQQLFPTNFDQFKTDIATFKNYTARVDGLIRRDQNTSSVNLTKRMEAMKNWTQGRIVSGSVNSSTANRRIVNSSAINIDEVAQYAFNDETKQRHCPLQFPNTLPFECQVTGSALKGSDKSTAVSAEVKFRIAGRSEFGALPSGKTATVSWKIGDQPATEATGLTLSKTFPEAEGAGPFQVSVSATVSGQTAPVTCSVSINTTVAQPLTGCAVQGEVVANISADNKLTITTPTVTPVPENAIPGEVKFIFGNDANAAPVAAMENIPLPADDSVPNQVVEFNFQAVMTSEGQTFKCPGKAKYTPPTPVPQAQSCSISSAAIAAITGKADKVKFDAAVTASQPLKEGEVIKWEVPGATIPAPSQALTLAIAEISKPTAAIDVKARIMKGETQVADCGTKKVEPPTPVKSPEEVAAKCEITATAANPTPDGKVIITANAVLTAEGKSGEKFDWTAPEEKKDKGASESFQITAPKEDTKIKITATAKYKVNNEDKTANCSQEVPVKKAAAPAATGGGGPAMPQQQPMQMPMQMPDIFIQGIR